MPDLMTSTPQPQRRRRVSGRPPRVETVGEDVMELYKVAGTREPHVFAQMLRRRMNLFLDEELETLATWVLSEADFDTSIPEVQGPLTRGEPDKALAALISRMRRRFAKALRDHQRSESDDFYDDCIVE